MKRLGFASILLFLTSPLLTGEIFAESSGSTNKVTTDLSGNVQKSSKVAGSVQDSMYHYVPVAGKFLGVWPEVLSVEQLSDLRLRYGFSGVFVYPDPQQYDIALQAGFSSSNMKMRIWESSYIYAVDNFPVGEYYIGEPVEHDCYGHTGGTHLFSPQELSDVADYIHQSRPGAKFVLDGYKRCSHNLIASEYADVFMYASYKNWDELNSWPPICHVNIGWGDEYERPWLPGNEDQRDSWTAMRNAYGTKYSKTWIDGGGDEYYDLFAHANALSLEGLWLFNAIYPIDSARVETFCDAAWQNGWLNKVPGEPLSVELSSFTASVVQQNAVLLEWTTLSEVNNYGFEIQKSPGQPNAYQTIPNSFIAGHGTTNVPNNYSYTDNTASAGTWFYRLKQIDLDGTTHFSDGIQVDVLTSVTESSLPTEYGLDQNYPNPFNPSTVIGFSLPSAAYVSLKVFNVLGKEVSTLVARELPAGKHEAQLDARALPSGTYFYRLHARQSSLSVAGQAGDPGSGQSFVDTRKLLLLK